MKTAIVASIAPTSFEALALSADVEASFALAARHGFDGLEIAVRDPAAVSPAAIKALAGRHHLEIAAIGTGQAWVEERLSLTDLDASVRAAAIGRLKRQLELGAELNAMVIIGLIRGTVANKGEAPAALELLAAALTELAAHAVRVGAPGLLLEPINRYETRLLNSVAATLDFLGRAPTAKVRLLADTFHMNLEDRDLAAAIRAAGPRLGHVHLADSNRHAPGQGHTDFGPILDALDDVGYQGFLSAEILPEPSPAEAVRLTGEFFASIGRGGARKRKG